VTTAKTVALTRVGIFDQITAPVIAITHYPLRHTGPLKTGKRELVRGEFYARVGIPTMLTRSKFEV
jgi:hypothetical protein